MTDTPRADLDSGGASSVDPAPSETGLQRSTSDDTEGDKLGSMSWAGVVHGVLAGFGRYREVIVGTLLVTTTAFAVTWYYGQYVVQMQGSAAQAATEQAKALESIAMLEQTIASNFLKRIEQDTSLAKSFNELQLQVGTIRDEHDNTLDLLEVQRTQNTELATRNHRLAVDLETAKADLDAQLTQIEALNNKIVMSNADRDNATEALSQAKRTLARAAGILMQAEYLSPELEVLAEALLPYVVADPSAESWLHSYLRSTAGSPEAAGLAKSLRGVHFNDLSSWDVTKPDDLPTSCFLVHGVADQRPTAAAFIGHQGAEALRNVIVVKLSEGVVLSVDVFDLVEVIAHPDLGASFAAYITTVSRTGGGDYLWEGGSSTAATAPGIDLETILDDLLGYLPGTWTIKRGAAQLLRPIPAPEFFERHAGEPSPFDTESSSFGIGAIQQMYERAGAFDPHQLLIDFDSDDPAQLALVTFLERCVNERLLGAAPSGPALPDGATIAAVKAVGEIDTPSRVIPTDEGYDWILSSTVTGSNSVYLQIRWTASDREDAIDGFEFAIVQ